MASGSIKPKKDFIRKSYSYTGSAGSSGTVWNITRTNLKMTVPEGYTPFSFTAFYTGNEYIAASRIQPRNTGTVASIKKLSGGSVSPTFSLTVTYIPEEMVVDVSGKYSVEIAEASEAFGQVVDPVTRSPIDQLFFTPDETIGFWFRKYDDSDPTQQLSSISLSYSNGTSETLINTNWIEYNTMEGRYYLITMTMPSKSIVATGNYT